MSRVGGSEVNLDLWQSFVNALRDPANAPNIKTRTQREEKTWQIMLKKHQSKGCWWWHSWVVPPLACSADVWGGGVTKPPCSSSDTYHFKWCPWSCQRAQTYCIHWSALPAALASRILSLFSTKGFVLSEWHMQSFYKAKSISWEQREVWI